MKTLLRVYVIHLLAVWVLTYIFKGSFTVNGGLVQFLVAALILSLLNFLLKPILKLLFFPVNVITLGLFSVIINIIVFYIFVRISSFVNIAPWEFTGFTLGAISIGAYTFNFIETLFVATLSLSLITNILMFFLK